MGSRGGHAVDDLQSFFARSNRDLSLIRHKLESEFRLAYPDNVNPLKLVSRIKRVEEELSSLREQSRELLSAKQDLMDRTRTTLVGNRGLLQRVQASAGITLNDDGDDSAIDHLVQIIDEWNAQVGLRGDNEKQSSVDEDVNQLLFSAKVQNI
ncbi:hypothetical protein EJ110_NYTH51857 [Nymphaea thermarum]|nr:hypothetical protein EJ110_NYTH51857 [Nymphaea thermarum]